MQNYFLFYGLVEFGNLENQLIFVKVITLVNISIKKDKA